MTAQNVTVPYEFFTGLDGKPLDAGYIYIGQDNLDPETNPITVYWDDALSITAQQPIRTQLGFPVRSGSPAEVFAGSKYSITVKNSRGELVYTNLSCGDELIENLADSSDVAKGDALVTVKAPLTGATARTQHQKNQEWLSVLDFGADPTGVSDSYTQITAAVTAAVGAGKGLIFPPGTYLHSNTLNFGYPNLHIRGVGAVYLKCTGTVTHCVSQDGGVAAVYQQGTLENLHIIGSANTVNGLYRRNFVQCSIKDIDVRDVTGKAFYISGDVSSNYENCRVASAGNPFSVVPQECFTLTSSAYITALTDCNFINCIAETAKNYGFNLEAADNNNFIGGTAEGIGQDPGGAGAGIGIRLGAGSDGNTFVNVFCEVNPTGGDLVCDSARNTFIGCQFSSRAASAPYYSTRSVSLASGAAQNKIEGCYIYSALVSSGANCNVFDRCEIGHQVDDSGTATQVTNTKQANITSAIIPGVVPGNVESPDTKTLDWYQEGTFTPTIGGSTTNGTLTYTVNSGKYTRIGNLVYISLCIVVATRPTAPTGILLIKGLPAITPSDTPVDQGLAVAESSNLTLGAGRTQCSAYINSAGFIRLNSSGNAVADALVDGSGIAANSTITISGHYFV